MTGDRLKDQQRTQSPGAVIEFDFFAQLSCHDGVLSLQADAELLLLQDDREISRAGSLRDWSYKIDLAQDLMPGVWEFCE